VGITAVCFRPAKVAGVKFEEIIKKKKKKIWFEDLLGSREVISSK
jgi:hypothetical protein